VAADGTPASARPAGRISIQRAATRKASTTSSHGTGDTGPETRDDAADSDDERDSVDGDQDARDSNLESSDENDEEAAAELMQGAELIEPQLKPPAVAAGGAQLRVERGGADNSGGGGPPRSTSSDLEQRLVAAVDRLTTGTESDSESGDRDFAEVDGDLDQDGYELDDSKDHAGVAVADDLSEFGGDGDAEVFEGELHDDDVMIPPVPPPSARRPSRRMRVRPTAVATSDAPSEDDVGSDAAEAIAHTLRATTGPSLSSTAAQPAVAGAAAGSVTEVARPRARAHADSETAATVREEVLDSLAHNAPSTALYDSITRDDGVVVATRRIIPEDDSVPAPSSTGSVAPALSARPAWWQRATRTLHDHVTPRLYQVLWSAKMHVGPHPPASAPPPAGQKKSTAVELQSPATAVPATGRVIGTPIEQQEYSSLFSTARQTAGNPLLHIAQRNLFFKANELLASDAHLGRALTAVNKPGMTPDEKKAAKALAAAEKQRLAQAKKEAEAALKAEKARFKELAKEEARLKKDEQRKAKESQRQNQREMKVLQQKQQVRQQNTFGDLHIVARAMPRADLERFFCDDLIAEFAETEDGVLTYLEVKVRQYITEIMQQIPASVVLSVLTFLYPWLYKLTDYGRSRRRRCSGSRGVSMFLSLGSGSATPLGQFTAAAVLEAAVKCVHDFRLQVGCLPRICLSIHSDGVVTGVSEDV